jgi:hypothetical protein
MHTASRFISRNWLDEVSTGSGNDLVIVALSLRDCYRFPLLLVVIPLVIDCAPQGSIRNTRRRHFPEGFIENALTQA